MYRDKETGNPLPDGWDSDTLDDLAQSATAAFEQMQTETWGDVSWPQCISRDMVRMVLLEAEKMTAEKRAAFHISKNPFYVNGHVIGRYGVKFGIVADFGSPDPVAAEVVAECLNERLEMFQIIKGLFLWHNHDPITQEEMEQRLKDFDNAQAILTRLQVRE
jgi:hypothetical protein